LGAQAPPRLPQYRVRVLDGNHLAGTEHQIFELRRFRAAALPGQALAFYDPRYGLITDVIPCEDTYAQELALASQALAEELWLCELACRMVDKDVAYLGASVVFRILRKAKLVCPYRRRSGRGPGRRRPGGLSPGSEDGC